MDAITSTPALWASPHLETEGAKDGSDAADGAAAHGHGGRRSLRFVSQPQVVNGSQTHGQSASWSWSACIDTPHVYTCPSGQYLAGIALPEQCLWGISQGSCDQPVSDCSIDDVKFYCCNISVQ